MSPWEGKPGNAVFTQDSAYLRASWSWFLSISSWGWARVTTLELSKGFATVVSLGQQGLGMLDLPHWAGSGVVTC